MNLYLLSYNAIQVLGWSFVLSCWANNYLTSESPLTTAYEATYFPLQIFQYAAVLEVVHAALGLVKANPVITSVQVASRVWLVFLSGYVLEGAQSYFYSQMVVSWCFAEIIRYLMFTFKELGLTPPYFLYWLRYSAFYILYPTGASGEVGVMYNTLPFWASTGKWSIFLPNVFNFSFSFEFFIKAMCVVYIPGLYTMMSHMARQRKNALRKYKTQ
eukprot:TRINITY_DN10685_c0_g1_i1.p1 TRINITY_DN10685_c0_g1~~TRINITY_DN10685_c0_g1_i1.p1  ORF type:complete len:215 (-),score=16.66 TRINITY_DN10685_c0_g1_i1:39-683(-)